MARTRTRRRSEDQRTPQLQRALAGSTHGSSGVRPAGAAAEILRLQRQAGNAAVSRLLADLKAPGPTSDDEQVLDSRAGVAAPPAPTVQRTIGDGHDLSSPRFAGDAVLEAVFDNERLLSRGSSGAAVSKVQQALVDYGFRLPSFGVDGKFGKETRAAVSSFQADSGLSGGDIDGVIGPITMAALDRRGVTFAGPGSAVGGAGAAPAAGPGGISVTMPPHIRAASTPETMAQDRIPPSVDTPVSIGLTGFAAPAAPVTLSVDGAGAANGTVTIDGAATRDITGATVVQLRGVTQTSPGSGGNLQLVARQGATEIARSGDFSVSAIAQFYTDAFVSDVTGAQRGVVVQDGWESDSGSVADLDQVDLSEQVEVTTATGCFSGLGGATSGYLPATAFTQDTHGTPAAALTSPGRRIAQQTSMFRDKRTGATDIPMRDSGYEIDRRCTAAGPGFRLKTTKVGKATTANGVPSGAGAGSIIRPPQAV